MTLDWWEDDPLPEMVETDEDHEDGDPADLVVDDTGQVIGRVGP